jgi:NAD(P)-dependent dehydrogenase (short-subunit alcohol dehydrogenase family)
MKTVITGNTRLAEFFPDAHHIRIDDEINFEEYDVFINHAHRDFDQLYLLEKVAKQWWDNPQKLIINISSRASQPNCSKGYMYAAQKSALDHYSNNLTYNSTKQFRMCTLNLGLLESDLPSCTFTEVYDIITYIIGLPSHLEIPQMYFQHSQNYSSIQILKEKKFNV